MNTSSSDNWIEANQKYLKESLAPVRKALELHSSPRDADTESSSQLRSEAFQNMLEQPAGEMTPPPALDTLCAAFGLSPFERDVLLLCAGMELDSTFAPLCAAAQGDPLRAYPTFSLALAALPEPHWSAFNPGAPLRRWRLIEVGAGNILTISPLRIDEHILHYLTGVQYPDERLAGFVEPLQAPGSPVPSHSLIAGRLAAAWSKSTGLSALPVIQLCGTEGSSKRTIAAAACASVGLNLHMISAGAIPQNPGEVESLGRLWERESILSTSALLVDCDEADPVDAARERAITQFIEHTGGAIIVTSRMRRSLRQRPMVTFDVHKPTPDEQRAIWKSMLGKTSSQLNGEVDLLVSQFNMNTQEIQTACSEVPAFLASGDSGSSGSRTMDDLWDVCRAQMRPRLDDLAQRIETHAAWGDLVIPQQQEHILREIAIHVRQRFKVYEKWGFASKSSRGLGISALFTGASGTGKTMAAEVIANELRLDLYRIDLSQVVSKYIGETEKNLRRVFDAAEDGGAVLLFDEADALFGKRSEVKDSHDRYANIEISYLLQRMEAYRGLAILTTNMKSALDSAFLRRIRFIVQFPFPDMEQRARIWKHIFPKKTTRGLKFEKLARLNVAGGNIRNIALNAAFLAAESGELVGMKHLLHAARLEYSKLEKPLTEAEIGGWV